MILIDFSRADVPNTGRKALHNERVASARNECKRRIGEIASERAQHNMLAAKTAGLLPSGAEERWTNGVKWIGEMLKVARELPDDENADIEDDANWPEPPKGFKALAHKY